MSPASQAGPLAVQVSPTASIGAAAAEDASQDVALQAYANLHTLRDPDRFGGWICTIARNAARDVHTEHRRRQETSLDDDHSIRDEDALELCLLECDAAEACMIEGGHWPQGMHKGPYGRSSYARVPLHYTG